MKHIIVRYLYKLSTAIISYKNDLESLHDGCLNKRLKSEYIFHYFFHFIEIHHLVCYMHYASINMLSLNLFLTIVDRLLILI